MLVAAGTHDYGKQPIDRLPGIRERGGEDPYPGMLYGFGKSGR